MSGGPSLPPNTGPAANHIDPRWGPLGHIEILVIDNREDGYVVFLDQDLDVDWKTTDAYDQAPKKAEDAAAFGRSRSRSARLHAVPVEHLDEGVRRSYRLMLGEATARALAFDFEASEEIFAHAAEFVSARNQEMARLWFLGGAGIGVAICAAAMAAAWFSRENLTTCCGPTALVLAVAGGFGAIGGFFSALFRDQWVVAGQVTGPRCRHGHQSSVHRRPRPRLAVAGHPYRLHGSRS